MFTLYSDRVQDIFDQVYSKQESIKTSEAVDTSNTQRSEQNISIYSLAIALN